MISKKDIIKYILQTVKENGYYHFDKFDEESQQEFLKETNSNITLHTTLGGEGDMAPMVVILKVIPKDKPYFFVRVDGYHSSWAEDQWEEAYEAEEYEKIVKDWRAVK